MTQIIELIGTPGAGKTSLISYVLEFYLSRGIQANTVLEAPRPFAQHSRIGRLIAKITPPSLRRQMLWLIFFYLSFLNRYRFRQDHPQLIKEVQTSQRQRTGQKSLKKQRVPYWFYYLTGSFQFLAEQARTDEFLIFYEGFTHRVVQFNASDCEAPSREKIIPYLQIT